MESRARSVLAHDPCIRVAYFFDFVSGKLSELRIPPHYRRIFSQHTLSYLHQRMLDVTWMLVVSQVGGKLFIGQLSAEPGIPPEKKRHEHDQPAGHKKKNTVAGGHPGTGFPGLAGYGK